MNDPKLLTFGALAVVGLVYCLWKTQADYQAKKAGLIVAWGVAAWLSAFFFVAFIFASKVLSDL